MPRAPEAPGPAAPPTPPRRAPAPAPAPTRAPARPTQAPAQQAPAAYAATPIPAGTPTGDAAVAIARQLVNANIWYRWGGTNPSTGLDCSGLTQYIMKRLNISIPRVTQDQVRGGQGVNGLGNARPGDLLYFRFSPTPDDPGVNHTGIYIGHGMMIEAATTGTKVRVTQLSSFYTNQLAGIRRYTTPGTGQATNDTNSLVGLPTGNLFGGGGASVTTYGAGLDQFKADGGWNSAVFSSDPELQTILNNAIATNMTPERIRAEIQQTNWFKQNSVTMRQAIITRLSQPGEWAQVVSQKAADMKVAAATMGSYLTDTQANQYAEQSVIFGWNQPQVNAALSHYVTASRNGNYGGAAGTIQDRLEQTAYNNGIKLPTSWFSQHMQNIAAGTSTEQDAHTAIRDLAASTFPQYSEQLKAGMDVSNIAAPYVQSMASTLELNPTQLNVFDPTIRKALTGADEKGKPASTPLWQFEQTLKNDPRYAKTNGAMTEALTAGNKVLTDMGMI